MSVPLRSMAWMKENVAAPVLTWPLSCNAGWHRQLSFSLSQHQGTARPHMKVLRAHTCTGINTCDNYHRMLTWLVSAAVWLSVAAPNWNASPPAVPCACSAM